VLAITLFRRPKRAPEPSRFYVLYTSGDDILTPTQYRSNFEHVLERGLGGHANLSDETRGPRDGGFCHRVCVYGVQRQHSSGYSAQGMRCSEAI
jgi:hypothetical protein